MIEEVIEPSSGKKETQKKDPSEQFNRLRTTEVVALRNGPREQTRKIVERQKYDCRLGTIIIEDVKDLAHM